MKTKKCLILVLSVVMTIAIMVVGCAKPAPAPEPIVLEVITPYAADQLEMQPFLKIYVDRLNEAAKGEMVLKHVGASEVIPGFEQPKGIMTGIVDMGMVYGSYYKGEVPEAYGLAYSKYTPEQELESGFHDLMVKLHKEANLYYIGRGSYPLSYGMEFKVPITKVADFQGLRFRGMAVQEPLLKELGVTLVTLPVAETYGALERGIVDGCMLSLTGFLDRKLYEVCTYYLDHTLWEAWSAPILVNLDVWNKLPKHLQDLMQDVYWEVRPEWTAYCKAEFDEKVKASLQELGMKPVRLPPNEAEWFHEMQYRVAWEAMKIDMRPEYYEQVKKLTGN